MINIKSWDKSDVKVILKLIAKNVDIDIAREELNRMNYALTETRNSVYVSNRMQVSKSGKAVSSVIRAEYEIYVPLNIQVHLNNGFGNVRIEKVTGGIFGELYYSDLNIEEYSGDIDLQISTGDFTCSKSILNGKVYVRHANTTISETEGRLHVESEYGKIRLNYGNMKLYSMLITEATDIEVRHKFCYPLELILSGNYCPLEIEKDCYIPQGKFLESNYDPDDNEKTWKLRYLPPNKATRLIIDSKFGSINLR